MIRLTMVCIAGLCLSGCFSWQESYDSAARRECREIVAAEARQECLTHVERNSAERRSEQRS